jgi:P-type Na+/K+ transporter
VTATGMATEVGKIANMLRANPLAEDLSRAARLWKRLKATTNSILGFDGTPLQVKLSKFALLLFALAALLVIIVFSASRFEVGDEVLIYGICVGVAVIPESLIAVLTISMAVGVKAMAKGHVIVRKIASLEAVGGVTNICTDKTGTLTQGKMITRKIWLRDGSAAAVEECTHPHDPTSGKVTWGPTKEEVAPEGFRTISKLPQEARSFIKCISLCNNSTITDGKAGTPDDLAEISTTSTSAPINWRATGEPTEIALHVFAMRFGLSKSTITQSDELQLAAEFPFDSTCKRMSVVYRDSAGCLTVYTKGALEAVLPLLDATDELKAELNYKAESLAAEGLRVLCIAYRVADGKHDVATRRETAESNLTVLGLAGLYDPPRPETATAVQECKRAGIAVHMLTGDHIKTATAIAHEVGILDKDNSAPHTTAGTETMHASAFDALSNDEIDKLEKLPLVLARCSPSTKVRMVEALHRRGAFCVMTGDGVNDSPALKKVDVGIAMGLNGSDVAKEAADMVLTDDNFASIVTAIREGRRLFDNIQKFLLHLLVSNIAQVILLLIALAFKDGDGASVFPLSPLEILWANLITSSFLAVGLGLEEAQADVMVRPPHDMRVGVFTWELIIDKMAYGFFMGSLCLAAFVSTSYAPDGTSPWTLGESCNEQYNESVRTYHSRVSGFS